MIVLGLLHQASHEVLGGPNVTKFKNCRSDNFLIGEKSFEKQLIRRIQQMPDFANYSVIPQILLFVSEDVATRAQ